VQLDDLRHEVLKIFEDLESGLFFNQKNEAFVLIQTEEDRVEFMNYLGENLGIDFSFLQKSLIEEILLSCPVQDPFSLTRFCDLIWMIFYGDYYMRDQIIH
jgi:hypothetical protein